MNKENVNKLQAQINALEAKKAVIINSLTSENEVILHEEILNLLDGVGDGYISGDYYAPNRYYSKIGGVKNIRRCGDTGILVKIVSPSGYLLPDKINVRGNEMNIVFTESDKFEDELDY